MRSNLNCVSEHLRDTSNMCSVVHASPLTSDRRGLVIVALPSIIISASPHPATVFTDASVPSCKSLSFPWVEYLPMVPQVY